MAFRDLHKAADTNSSILNNRLIRLREAATIERDLDRKRSQKK
jgi:hypothetical protein